MTVAAAFGKTYFCCVLVLSFFPLDVAMLLICCGQSVMIVVEVQP